MRVLKRDLDQRQDQPVRTKLGLTLQGAIAVYFCLWIFSLQNAAIFEGSLPSSALSPRRNTLPTPPTRSSGCVYV